MIFEMDDNNIVSLTMREHVERLEIIPKEFEAQQYVTARDGGSYIVAVNRLDLTYEFAKQSHVQKHTSNYTKYLNRAIMQLIREPRRAVCRSIRTNFKTDG